MPSSTEIGCTWPNLCRLRPSLAKYLPTSAKHWPDSADMGQTLAKLSQVWLNLMGSGAECAAAPGEAGQFGALRRKRRRRLRCALRQGQACGAAAAARRQNEGHAEDDGGDEEEVSASRWQRVRVARCVLRVRVGLRRHPSVAPRLVGMLDLAAMPWASALLWAPSAWSTYDQLRPKSAQTSPESAEFGRLCAELRLRAQLWRNCSASIMHLRRSPGSPGVAVWNTNNLPASSARNCYLSGNGRPLQGLRHHKARGGDEGRTDNTGEEA